MALLTLFAPLVGLMPSGSITAPFAGIYSPVLTAAENPIILHDTDNNVEMEFVVTATDENGAVIDWTNNNYALSSVNLVAVSINDQQDISKAVFTRSITSGNRTPTSTSLKLFYAFTAADIALMPLIIYDVFAVVTLTNGEVRTVWRVRVERNQPAIITA